VAQIVGWGVDAGVKYWTVVNSWNTDWGMNGCLFHLYVGFSSFFLAVFWIKRGSNECGIESQVCHFFVVTSSICFFRLLLGSLACK